MKIRCAFGAMVLLFIGKLSAKIDIMNNEDEFHPSWHQVMIMIRL